MFHNQFAERIASYGTILSLKKGHIKKIGKEMTKRPKSRKIEQELSNLLKKTISKWRFI